MNNIIISKMQESHINQVYNISALSFHTPWTVDSLKDELSSNKYARYFVASIDDLVVGYGGIWIIIDEAHVTNIAVHPEYRGIGIGKKILEALIEQCKIEFIPSMTLEVRVSNAVAISLYKSYGFSEEGIRKKYYGDTGEDGIIMWKRNIV